MALKRIKSGSGHRYTLDGQRCDGVTTLIKGGLPAPALMYWSAKQVAEYVADVDQSTLDTLRTLGRDGMVNALKGVPWSARDAAAVRGTEVHALAEQLIHGTRVEVPDPLAGHVDSCLAFFDQWKPTPVVVEGVVGSRRWRYGGTLDLICDLPDGRRALMDYKTGASGIWPETALQLAAYRSAEFYVDSDDAEQPMVDVDATYAVWLRADGYDVIPVNTEPHVFQTFLHVAFVARQAAADDGLKSWIGEPVELPAAAVAA